MNDLSFLLDKSKPFRQINLWETDLYRKDQELAEAKTEEDLRRILENWPPWDRTMSFLENFLTTRRATGRELRVFPQKDGELERVQTLSRMYAQVSAYVRKYQERKSREELEAVKMNQTVDEQTESLKAISSMWLERAKENLKDGATEEGPSRRLSKVTVDKFMGQQSQHVEPKVPRRQKINKDICSRCGEKTSYIEEGNVRKTNFILCVGRKKLKVCRKCMKLANSHSTAEDALDSQHIDKKDRLLLKMSQDDANAMNFAVSMPSRSVRKKDKAKGMGTEADPILLSSDEEETEAQKKPAAFTRAVVSQCQRKTRQSSKVDTDPILDELRCCMPPTGGHGSVSFGIRDYFRLGPEEFLNDSCIDYYMKYLEQRLETEKPEDAKRCYFFNSFFYKKLSDTTSQTAISDETQALVGSIEGLDKISLQALRCYDVTKSWTRKFDLFSKDFLFIPIHDQLHWSLIVVCHPGAQIKMPTCNVKELREHKEAFMIHLDSLRPPGGHGSDKIAKLIKRYLQNEWTAKLKQEGDNVPKMWAQQHPEDQRDFLSMKVRRPALPMQDNYYDCGCFVCAFADQFVAHLPAKINAQMVPLGRGRDIFKNTRKAVFRQMPTFLAKNWFQSENASLLRHHLARMVLKAMAVNAGVMDDHGRWKLEDLSTNDSHKATFLMNSLEKLKEEGHYSPPSWENLPEESDDESLEICVEESSGKSRRAGKSSSSDDPIEEPSLDDKKKTNIRTKNKNVIMSDDDSEEEEILDIDQDPDLKRAKNEASTPVLPPRDVLRNLRRKRQLRNTPDVSLVSMSTANTNTIEIAESPKRRKSKNIFARRNRSKNKLAEFSAPFRNKLRRGFTRLPGLSSTSTPNESS